MGNSLVYERRAHVAISPGCPNVTEHSRKIASSAVLHNDTLLAIAFLQQLTKGDDVRVGQILEEIDLGIDRLGEHILVVHSQLERLGSEHL
jgi:hypothetical protein